MIRINLLPQETAADVRGAAKTSETSGTMVVALILIIAFAVVLGGGGWIYNYRSSELKRTARVKAEAKKVADELKDMKTQYAEVQDSMTALRNQIAVLKALDPENRLFWARKLNILPMLVPEGVFLTNIRVVEDVKEVETAESRARYAAWAKKKKGPAPSRVMKPVIKQKLDMEGVSYVENGTSDQRLQLIIDFYRSLENNKVEVPFSGEQVGFMEHFEPNIAFSPFEAAKISNRQCSKFKFTLISQPLTSEDSAGG
ncbi:hypothetical protein KQI84_03795 [bacterium]|nr:hypothetical protein [bacterium]